MLLPVACQMGAELRTYVHFALMSRSEMIYKNWEVDWYRFCRFSSSSRALYSCTRCLPRSAASKTCETLPSFDSSFPYRLYLPWTLPS